MKKYKQIEEKIEQLESKVNTLAFLVDHDKDDIVIDKDISLDKKDNIKVAYMVKYLDAGNHVTKNQVIEVYAGEKEEQPEIRINKVDGMEYVEVWQHNILSSVQKINRLMGTLKYENWTLYVTAYHKGLLKEKKEA